MTYLIMHGDIGIGIENFAPLRKKPCLTVIRGCEHTKVASFNNDESVNEFLKMLAEMGIVKEVEE